MLKLYWYRHFKYPVLMNDADSGIKSFTERQISRNLNVLRKKITTLDTKGLMQESGANPEYDHINIPESVAKENKRKKKVIPFILLLLALAEGFLNYVSTLVVIPGGQSHPILFLLLRLAVTLVLTLGSIICLEYFFEAYMHERITELKAKYGIDPDASNSFKNMMLWMLISLVFLVAVSFIVEKRAGAIEGSSKDLAYFGLIIISLVLPIAGGMLAFEYKRARKIVTAADGKSRYRESVRKTENQKAGKANGAINNRVKLIADNCTIYWNKINDFKAVKALYDKRKHGIKEPLGRYEAMVDSFVTYKQFIDRKSVV